MNKPLMTFVGLCAVGALAASLPALANPQATRGTTSSTATDNTKSRTDPSANSSASNASGKASKTVKSSEDFVKTAAQAGMLEVELSKLAQTKASDSKVRDLAEHMVSDHSKANAELEKVAKQKNINVPTSLDKEHQAMLDKFQSKNGKDFDKAYIQALAKDHRDAVALFKQASTASGVDSELQAFAKKTLPTLEEHQSMVKQTESIAKENSSAKSKDKATS